MAAKTVLRGVGCLRYGHVSRYRVLYNLLLESKLSKNSAVLNSCGYASTLDDDQAGKLSSEKTTENLKNKKHEKLIDILGSMKVGKDSQEDDESLQYMTSKKDPSEKAYQEYDYASLEEEFKASEMLENSNAQDSVLGSSAHYVKNIKELPSEVKITDVGEKIVKSDELKADKKSTFGVKRPLADIKSAASGKLAFLLNSMKIESIPRHESKISSKLATPIPRSKRPKMKSEKDEVKESAKAILDEKLLSAVEDVASTLGGDTKQTESELLKKLITHSVETTEEKAEGEPGVNLTNLFVGMKIDRSKRTGRVPMRQEQFDERQYMAQHLGYGSVGPAFDTSSREKQRRLQGTELMESTRVKLFESALNLFPVSSEDTHSGAELKTWKALEQKELKSLGTPPPTNPFEEMIRWTEEGKLWTFPIDNEVGLQEEKKVGFHEHVFLEDHLEGFPTKGPVHQFMKLVIIGLSMNSYITVQRKKEHIEWFRQYFKEKEEVLRQSGALIDETIA